MEDKTLILECETVHTNPQNWSEEVKMDEMGPGSGFNLLKTPERTGYTPSLDIPGMYTAIKTEPQPRPGDELCSLQCNLTGVPQKADMSTLVIKCEEANTQDAESGIKTEIDQSAPDTAEGIDITDNCKCELRETKIYQEPFTDSQEDYDKSSTSQQTTVSVHNEISCKEDPNFLHSHEDERPSTDAVCDKGFMEQSASIRLQTNLTEGPFQCLLCEKGFQYLTNFKMHQKTHEVEVSYKCVVCGKRYIRLSSLEAHKLTHIGEKRYKCNVCGKGYTRRSSLKIHKLVHTGQKPYKCTVCEKGLTTKRYLYEHERSHTGERPHKCSVCEKTFAREHILNAHKLTHTKKKLYQCILCSVSFARQGDLNVHKRTHSGEKPYKCDVCEKQFGRRSNLQRHLGLHTGERPYVCTVCGKGFNSTSRLSRHRNIHRKQILDI